MGKWIRENLVLVSGIALPVLLVAGFFVLNKAPGMLADPPRFDFLLVGYRYDYQHRGSYHLSFEVRDGRLAGRAVPNTQQNSSPNRQYAGIFRYDAAANSFTEIVFELPEGLDAIDEPVPLPLTETGGLKLDKRRQSPDGYTLEFVGYRGRGGLLGELFGMRNRNDSGYALKKDGAYIDLPRPLSDRYFHSELHFMGWIVEEGGAP